MLGLDLNNPAIELSKLDFFLSRVVCAWRLSSLAPERCHADAPSENPGGALDDVGDCTEPGRAFGLTIPLSVDPSTITVFAFLRLSTFFLPLTPSFSFPLFFPAPKGLFSCTSRTWFCSSSSALLPPISSSGSSIIRCCTTEGGRSWSEMACAGGMERR